MQSGTVVQKRTSDLNRRPQPTGVSKHSPESKRSLEPLSRKETQAQSAVKNRIAVSNSSPKQNRSVATQKVTRKNSCCRFLHWSSNPNWTNSKAKPKPLHSPLFKSETSVFRRLLEPVLHTTLAAITIHPLPCSDVPLSEKWYHAAGVPAAGKQYTDGFGGKIPGCTVCRFRIYTPNFRLITLSGVWLKAKVELIKQTGQFFNLTTLHNKLQLYIHLFTI